MTGTRLIGWLFAGLVCSAAVGQTQTAAQAPAQASAAASAAQGKAASPPADCMAVLDRLSKGIPANETGVALRSQGLLIRSPILIADNVITETGVVSAARVRVKIDSKGNVIPGSVTVQQSTGDPKLALVMTKAVPESLSFDVSGAFTVPKEFAFTTVYVVCASP